MVRVGTSGWSYPSGPGTWNGLFYPASRSKRAGTAGFDELRFYAEHFDTVEVNTTFYGQPRAEVTSAWANRTPAGFEFSLKLYQKFTHPKMFREAALRGAPGAQGAMLDLLAEVTQADIDEFRQGVEPLAVELRHRSWSEAFGETLALLNAQLGDPISGEFPRELVERYPELSALVRTGQAEPVGVPRLLV